MYPFAHLREAYVELWSSVRRHLGDGPDEPDLDTEPRAAWLRPDLLVGQACGWPLVTELADDVEVIGAFDVVAPFAAAGHYRSVLVAGTPISIQEWRARADTAVARNGPDSLSGWVSLQCAWGGVPANVLHTGGHVPSMRAVAARHAQLASIDALSFEFLAAAEPALAGHLHVIGHGPTVPTLPLVMARALSHRRDEVRAAFAAAVVDPSTAEACTRLRIRGFVPFSLEDYEPLRALLPSS
jgi:ABC-type phosphate/phosphonate transport system substrate-binding protein